MGPCDPGAIAGHRAAVRDAPPAGALRLEHGALCQDGSDLSWTRIHRPLDPAPEGRVYAPGVGQDGLLIGEVTARSGVSRKALRLRLPSSGRPSAGRLRNFAGAAVGSARGRRDSERRGGCDHTQDLIDVDRREAGLQRPILRAHGIEIEHDAGGRQAIFGEEAIEPRGREPDHRFSSAEFVARAHD